MPGSKDLKTYLSRPTGSGPWPGVVVIHEIFGYNDIVGRQADRLAEAGYLALAPDLFSDGGPRCVAATMTAMARGHGKAFDDIEAARTMLAEHLDCTGKVGVIGFCLGGGFALLVAARGFDAAAANYGILPRKLDDALTGACPVVASYGAKDPMIRGKSATAKLESSLTRLDIPHDVKLYPNAGHSFLNDASAGPRPLHAISRVINVGPQPEASADAWERIEAFFAEHLR